MGEWWGAENIDALIFRIVRADLQEKLRRNYKATLQLAGFYLINMQARRKAFEVGERHYDLGLVNIRLKNIMLRQLKLRFQKSK